MKLSGKMNGRQPVVQHINFSN